MEGRLVALLASLLALLVVGMAAGSPARAAQSWTVSMGDNYDYPFIITINVGDAVTWTNSGSQVHTTTADTGQAIYWNSGDVISGANFTYTFNVAGNFTYNCFYHPEMTGTVVVLQPVPEFPGLMAFLAVGSAVGLALMLNRRLRG